MESDHEKPLSQEHVDITTISQAQRRATSMKGDFFFSWGSKNFNSAFISTCKTKRLSLVLSPL